MSCPLCRSGELQVGVADNVLTLAETTLVVRGVPALVCDVCGERYFAAEITQQLLDLARSVQQAGVLVDVRRYVAA